MKKKEKEQREERERLRKIFGEDVNLFEKDPTEKAINSFEKFFTLMTKVIDYNDKNPDFIKKVDEFNRKVKEIQQDQEKEKYRYHS